MKRRTFIKAGVALGVVSMGSYFALPRFRDAVLKILKQDTGKLIMLSGAYEQFVAEATREQFWVSFSLSKKVLIILHTYGGILRSVLPLANKYQNYRGQIVGRFLLSTDYFTNKMNSTERVTYIAFYNPYKQPCSSPFSTIFYPETA